jgi:CRP/FNR family cyclic AMP-dependent transcriptional regulator
MDAEESLRKVSLFRELQPKQIKSLAKWAAPRNFQSGQAIVKEGQLGVGLYAIQSGKVSITVKSGSGERELRTMGPGESFGELALLDDQPRSATVSAVEPTTVLVLDKASFLAELRTYPEIGLSLIPVLVSWLRDADRKIVEAG